MKQLIINKKVILTILLLSTTLILISFQSRKPDKYFEYQNEYFVIENCGDKEVELTSTIKPLSSKKIGLHSFLSPNNSFSVYLGSKKITKKDTIFLEGNKPLVLTFKFKIESGSVTNWLTFKSTAKTQSEGRIKFKHGEIEVETNNVTNGEPIEVKISDLCSDSVKIWFPYGGTITTVCLTKVDLEDSLYNTSFPCLSYSLMELNRYMWIYKKDTGRYNVSFSSCHWGNNFILDLK